MNTEREALIEALDQYVENQSEHEADGPESAKLQAARRMLDKLLAPIVALAE